MVDPVQRIAVNHILGIVCDDEFESRSICLLVGEDVLEDPIEAIGFGRRPIVGTNGQDARDRIALRACGFRARVGSSLG